MLSDGDPRGTASDAHHRPENTADTQNRRVQPGEGTAEEIHDRRDVVRNVREQSPLFRVAIQIVPVDEKRIQNIAGDRQDSAATDCSNNGSK